MDDEPKHPRHKARKLPPADIGHGRIPPNRRHRPFILIAKGEERLTRKVAQDILRRMSAALHGHLRHPR